jgi:hypothetical protein
MIHTDGTPTIANAPTRRPARPTAVLDSGEAHTTLLERDANGISVRVHCVDGVIWLLVADGDGPHVAIIPPDKVLDAFDHPYLYV